MNVSKMFIKFNLFVGPNNSYIVQAHFWRPTLTLHLIVKLFGLFFVFTKAETDSCSVLFYLIMDFNKKNLLQ